MRMPADAKSPIRLELAVTGLLGKRTIARRFWSVPAWSLAGVVVGEALFHQSRSGRQIRSAADGSESWSWSGYKFTLYKDACERSWHALIDDAPKVYVVCKEADPSKTASTVSKRTAASMMSRRVFWGGGLRASAGCAKRAGIRNSASRRWVNRAWLNPDRPRWVSTPVKASAWQMPVSTWTRWCTPTPQRRGWARCRHSHEWPL